MIATGFFQSAIGLTDGKTQLFNGADHDNKL